MATKSGSSKAGLLGKVERILQHALEKFKLY